MVKLKNDYSKLNSNIVMQLKRKIAELKKSEKRFKEIADLSREMVWETDVDGLYVYVNRFSEELTGYAPKELIGKKHFYDLHPAEGREEFKKAAFSVFEKKLTFNDLHNTIQRKDGKIITVSTNGTPVLSKNGKLLGYRGSDFIIADKKKK